MTSTNITNFRREIFSIIEQTVKYNEPVTINTKDGNAVMISENDYNGLMETLYLVSIPGMREKIIEGENTPLSECVGIEELDW